MTESCLGGRKGVSIAVNSGRDLRQGLARQQPECAEGRKRSVQKKTMSDVALGCAIIMWHYGGGGIHSQSTYLSGEVSAEGEDLRDLRYEFQRTRRGAEEKLRRSINSDIVTGCVP